ncbi:hypothetical protein M408DRAFT_284347 [Serendipita vermifera MAFF 305830]|uniref:Uncharacterized protein n=1 Tax=Serendipita vermifera MAFF 305830 TaxID=933852 RepID=A0A0C2WYS5_SERVB|nr:hypothetical protein M408DRAFT_284347 [Serendipita vermifera MAFF 305830]
MGPCSIPNWFETPNAESAFERLDEFKVLQDSKTSYKDHKGCNAQGGTRESRTSSPNLISTNSFLGAAEFSSSREI